MHYYTIVAILLLALAVALLFFLDNIIAPNAEHDALKMIREHHMLIAGAALFGAYYLHTLTEKPMVYEETSSSMDLPSYDEATSTGTSDILNL
jgi:hypothetical protein